MDLRLRKIGWEKASIVNKHFDKVYDYWKNKALDEHGYDGELKLIKEKNKVFFFIILDNIDQYTDREDWHPPINDNDDYDI